VPLLVDGAHPDHVKLLENWMKSYKAEELFDENGRLIAELAELAPKGDRRMGANPHANGGLLLHDLRMPDFHDHAVNVVSPGAIQVEDTLVLGSFLRDVAKLNQDKRNFRIFGPDETVSNLLQAVFEVTNRQWDAREFGNDEFLAPQGRVLDSMLSENQCEGWLEGYLLTGRHGLFNSYEAFIRIIDSMFSQHAKCLKVCRELPWRRDISSLNYLLASHVWQQDHNGFTHQDPGFLDHVINKKADKHYINAHDQGSEPDVVMACCGAGERPSPWRLARTSVLSPRGGLMKTDGVQQKTIVGNWKMHTTSSDAEQLARGIVDGLRNQEGQTEALLDRQLGLGLANVQSEPYAASALPTSRSGRSAMPNTTPLRSEPRKHIPCSGRGSGRFSEGSCGCSFHPVRRQRRTR
jgi:hypothetical protein